MTWVKNDDGMSIHRKVSPLSDAAYRLQQEAKEWCSRNLTDGRILADEFPSSSCRATPKYAAELVRRGLWHRAGGEHCGHAEDKCLPPGVDGYSIHDYLDYNPSADEVIRDRLAKAERQRRWLEKRKNGRRPTNPSGDASQVASRDGPEDALETLAPSPSPPRREAGKGTFPEATLAAVGGGASAGVEDQNHAWPPDSYGKEDPQAVAAEQRRLEALAAHQESLRLEAEERAHRGAAAARAALAGGAA